jgi:hypothetical protein
MYASRRISMQFAASISGGFVLPIAVMYLRRHGGARDR